MLPLFPLLLPLASPPLALGPSPQEAIGPTLPYEYASRDLDTGERGHFLFHYALEGEHAIAEPDINTSESFVLPSGRLCTLEGGGSYTKSNAPDYIERLGCYLEEGLSKFRDLGFNGGEIPPELGRVFVVLYDHSGTAVPLNFPIVSGDILLKSTMGQNTSKTVPVHEVFHQFQYTYTTHLEAWWLLEGTAKWSEDCVVDEANRYRSQMNIYLEDPSVGLFKASYSAVAFWRYLSEHYGAVEAGCDVNVSLQRHLWEGLGEGLRGPAAVDRALALEGYAETMDGIFGGDFALALLLKDSPEAEARHHFDENEEADYQGVNPESVHNLAPGEAMEWTGALPPYALTYHKLTLGSGAGALTFETSGRVRGLGAQVVFLQDGQAPSVHPLGEGSRSQTIAIPQGAQRAWVIMGTTSKGGDVAFTARVD